MAWTLPDYEYVKYRRNPLAAVIAQLRFHPILKIEKDQAGFQDRVRQQFPRFGVGEIQDVRVDFQGAQVTQRREYRFDTLDQKMTVTLSATSLSLISRAHESRAVFGAAMKLAMDSLASEYGQVVGTRLGLRYINHVSRQQIADDLDRELSWSDLIHADFLRLPRDLSDLEGTRYVMEARSTMNRGELTLRYGLIQEQPSGQVMFRLDTDRYLGEEFDASGTQEILNEFSRDIYAVFRAAAAPGLEEWMEPESGGTEDV
ncbi:MAG: TIGR04255 family protein [Deltaproteobacteria bacterium]|nr:MAG: TIGR04255 family protein [Deltaproteobacteria bacterium]